MKVTPVGRYSAPKYPTKQQVMRNPELLKKLPARWQAKPVVCTALLFTLSTGLYGCSSFTNRGSYGCVSVAPPVFLSEEEAAQIISDEAAKEGIVFSVTDKAIESNRLPETHLFGGETTGTRSGELVLDGYDEALDIGYEFVSQNDVVQWAGDSDGYWASVSTFDMKGAAKYLAEAVTNTAVFYDPGVDHTEESLPKSEDFDSFDEYIEQYSEAQKEKLEEKLRAQVRDFLDWLAAQGVI